MAEALATLSLAANIAQFIGLSMQMASTCKEIYSSANGIRQEYKELGGMVENMQELHKDVVTSLHAMQAQVGQAAVGQSTLKVEKVITDLAADCEPIATKLLDILNSLKVPDNTEFRVLKVVGKMVRYAWKSKDIHSLTQRIGKLDSQLKERVSFLLNTNNHLEILGIIRNLNEEQKALHVTTHTEIDKMRLEVVNLLAIESDDMLREVASLEQTAAGLEALVATVKNMQFRHHILRDLGFDLMNDREDNVRNAHSFTLDWIFETNKSCLAEWLAHGRGVFWIYGKAGSGKSTLMKHLSKHKKTLSTLAKWAGTDTLATASFYFWNAGSSMQKSKTGLLQSLLYQVIAACPSVNLFHSSLFRNKFSESIGYWKRSELIDTLKEFAQLSSLPVKFCLFINGLDEYKGEEQDIIELLQDFATSPNIKICASSRPRTAFWNAFHDSRWKLKVEDFTRDDMRKYTHDLLNENPSFQKFTIQNRERIQRQISKKAEGVWLWVYLVIRDLLRDLAGDEDYDHLQTRMDSFPSDLHAYFKVMMERIDKIHRQETARIFLVALEAVSPLPILSLPYIRMEISNPDYVYQIPSSHEPLESEEDLCQRWRKLLNSRCGDLLEINQSSADNESYLDFKVWFIHRTVKDFLCDDYHEKLRIHAGNFIVQISLFKMMVALIKERPSVFREENLLEDFARDVFEYALRSQSVAGNHNISILDAFNAAGEYVRDTILGFPDSESCWASGLYHGKDLYRIRTNKYRFNDKLSNDQHPTRYPDFLGLTIWIGLHVYAFAKLNEDPKLVNSPSNIPYLAFALCTKEFNITIVKTLLTLGADPNASIPQYYGGCNTVWKHFHWSGVEMGIVDPNNRKEAILLLLEHGADSDTTTLSQEMGRNIEDDYIRWFGKEDAKMLFARMRELQRIKQSQFSLFQRILRWR
ncbi:hypothetical protein B0J11DRAFT_475230 [Dendryphion nanum]|uniref:NACHT domain-containing protein n=1 Tax=Dendryphion nanum TaxID=256645 RepID=A0A9P9IY38_9PLEO|nr:hypothetical protein B0J11DRAFT_475230 [Dendryphion nanum]